MSIKIPLPSEEVLDRARKLCFSRNWDATDPDKLIRAGVEVLRADRKLADLYANEPTLRERGEL